MLLFFWAGTKRGEVNVEASIVRVVYPLTSAIAKNTKSLIKFHVTTGTYLSIPHYVPTTTYMYLK